MVYIAQVLCPSRHCVIAAAVACDTEEAAQDLKDRVWRHLQLGIAGKRLNPWCGICHSRELRVEVGRPRFKTMEEAQPHLAQQERENLLAAQVLGQPGRN